MTPAQAARSVAGLDLDECVRLVHVTPAGREPWAHLCERVFVHGSAPTLWTDTGRYVTVGELYTQIDYAETAEGLRVVPGRVIHRQVWRESTRRVDMLRAAACDRVARALEVEANHRQHEGPVVHGAARRFPLPTGEGPAAITIAEAHAWISRRHRHLARRPSAARMAVGLRRAGILVGAAILANPARELDDGETVVIARTCVLDCRHAAGQLLGAATRLAREAGFRRAITYTLPSESGITLRATGWTCEGETKGGEWARGGRRRQAAEEGGVKVRWTKVLATAKPQDQRSSDCPTKSIDDRQ